MYALTTKTNSPLFVLKPKENFSIRYEKFHLHSLIGEQHTLGDLLHEFAPEVFANGIARMDNEWRIVIQGIEPPLETPIHWISEHFSHPDNFLYIVIVRVV